ncbi:hypothetical protein MO867_02045 [Microbulbifer sp. OS29]|uniref:Uncharacterized protein n=1 Tax=Microbulbifer okhotskensis TaxID=2926617 RepID=A0A9X2EJ04_9GAMM|nr:hypothetical protein [Microbulbifer okhotskensis]MCO1333112.1 hypothetical protein [Microbulbifer okhotskensis]
MTTKQTWIVVTKSRPLEGCDIDIDGCEFYFADAYVSLPGEIGGAKALSSVLEKVQKKLEDDRFELAEVKMCMQFLPEEWVDQTDGVYPMHELASSSLDTDDVILGGYRSEEIQELFLYHHNVKELEAE